jgi:hypothetical protein
MMTLIGSGWGGAWRQNIMRNLMVDSSTLCRQEPGLLHAPRAIMSQFRATKLDIGCFTKIRNIRDHTKRKVFSENEPERYARLHLQFAAMGLIM